MKGPLLHNTRANVDVRQRRCCSCGPIWKRGRRERWRRWRSGLEAPGAQDKGSGGEAEQRGRRASYGVRAGSCAKQGRIRHLLGGAQSEP